MNAVSRISRFAVVTLLSGFAALSATSALAQEVAAAHAAPPAAAESFPRLRLGISVGAGVGTNGFGLRASLRGGVQLTPEIAVSYQLSGVADFAFSFLPHEAGWFSHAAFLEYVPRDVPWLILGLGPSIAHGYSQRGGCSSPAGPFCVGYPNVDFLAPGVDARVAAVIGSRGTNARGGLTIDFAVNATTVGLAATVGLGADLY